MSKNVVEPTHSVHYSKQQSHVSNTLSSKAKERARESLRENPAYKHLKMKEKSKKDSMLPKGKGSEASLEMQDIGKE